MKTLITVGSPELLLTHRHKDNKHAIVDDTVWMLLNGKRGYVTCFYTDHLTLVLNSGPWAGDRRIETNINSTVYAVAGGLKSSNTRRLARVIVGAGPGEHRAKGSKCQGLVVDHINGWGLDNRYCPFGIRPSNLRLYKCEAPKFGFYRGNLPDMPEEFLGILTEEERHVVESKITWPPRGLRVEPGEEVLA